MNYQKIYDNLIEKSRLRGKPDGYFEKHHIKPKALGGSDDISNLVNLTLREHYIAHLLLAKILGGKMIQAFFMMSRRCKNSHLFKKMKEEYLKIQSDTTKKMYEDNPEMKENLSKYWKQRSDYCKERASKNKVAHAKLAKYNSSEEGIKRARDSVAKKFHTEESKKKSAETRRTKEFRESIGEFFKNIYNDPRNCPTYKGPLIGTSVNNPKDVVILFGVKDIKKYGFSQSKISLCVNGKRSKHANRIWCYGDKNMKPPKERLAK